MIPKIILDEWDRLRAAFPELQRWALQEDKRAYSRHGITWFGKRVIGLSSWVWELNTTHDEPLLDTLRHEVAHVLAGYAARHGSTWKSWAEKMGAIPQAIRSRDHKFKLKAYAYTAACGVCGLVHYTRSRTGLAKKKRVPLCGCAQPVVDAGYPCRGEEQINELAEKLKPYVLTFSEQLQVIEL
jgi:predicted SprT family Zn-dependent metalloprotease